MTVRAPIVVCPVKCTWATSRAPSPMTTSEPMTQYGPMVAPGPITAPFSIWAVAAISAIGFIYDEHGADFSLGHRLVPDLGLTVKPPHVLLPILLGHVKFQGI